MYSSVLICKMLWAYLTTSCFSFKLMVQKRTLVMVLKCDVTLILFIVLWLTHRWQGSRAGGLQDVEGSCGYVALAVTVVQQGVAAWRFGGIG
jgi:hypothetical protein